MHLNRYIYFTRWLRDTRVGATLSRYTSNYDHQDQSFLTLFPIRETPRGRVFFFHGMDGDAGDVVVAHQLAWKYHLELVGPAGRGPCWMSDAFVADVTSLIDQWVSDQPEQKFYLMGVSMGAAQALSMASLISPRAQQQLRGVVAILPGPDLVDILRNTSHPRVRETLLASVGGMEQKLRERSAINLLDRVPSSIPSVFISCEADTIFPPKRLGDYLNLLRDRNSPLRAQNLPGEHRFEFDDFDYSPTMDFLLERS